MTKFSANLGFLWADLALSDAIRAAKKAGFDAVECHWPYETPSADVKAALDATGLDMLGLNTRRGDVSAGDNGLAALPGREDEARAAIDEALRYAEAIGTPNVHVMAGFASGDEASACFIRNLSYASDAAEKLGKTILIEPLNAHDAPGYFLRTTSKAAEIIARLGAANVKLMFDCYHVGRTEGDVIARLKTSMPIVGHIQFASVPDRGAPDHGEVDYRQIFTEIRRHGWTQPLGAEYKPNGETDATLGWMSGLG